MVHSTSREQAGSIYNTERIIHHILYVLRINGTLHRAGWMCSSQACLWFGSQLAKLSLCAVRAAQDGLTGKPMDRGIKLLKQATVQTIRLWADHCVCVTVVSLRLV